VSTATPTVAAPVEDDGRPAGQPTFSELQRDLPWSSPRAWRFATLGLLSRAGAGLSEGLAVGHRHGFDSGAFMDHAYRGRPGGRTPLGRALDRRLLERPTLTAFREIKDLARRAVDEALDAAGGVALVADLAAGPAPYLLGAVAEHHESSALVSDLDEGALAGARAAASRLGVEDRTRFRAADALDRCALAALSPRPDVVVELGLYGMVHDDERVRRHFLDLAELVAPEQIVFNVQTQNPEIEYIARVWRNREGGRCVWHLRPLSLVLGWAQDAGYAPASVAADSHGIYRVVRLVREGAPVDRGASA
jgi:predicted RNA methylase